MYVTVSTCVVRIVVVLATGTTRILTFRMTFLMMFIFLTRVVVEVGTFLTDLVPRVVVQDAGMTGPERASAVRAKSKRKGLGTIIMTGS